jgi:hypothetical protein
MYCIGLAASLSEQQIDTIRSYKVFFPGRS